MLGKKFSAGQLLEAQQELMSLDHELDVKYWDAVLKRAVTVAISKGERDFSLEKEAPSQETLNELKVLNRDLELSISSSGDLEVSIKPTSEISESE